MSDDAGPDDAVAADDREPDPGPVVPPAEVFALGVTPAEPASTDDAADAAPPEADEDDADEPWVSPGWSIGREPPGPDEVPLPNLPPPDAAAEPEEPAPVPAPAPAAAPAAAGPRRSQRPRLLIVAVLVAVVASALALAQAQDASDLRNQRDDQRAITDIAGRFGAAYLSFDYAHADRSGKAVTALATKDFAESYVAQSAPGIQQLFSSGQTTTKATTKAVYLGPVDGVRARALVVVDVAANSPSDGEQQLDDVSFVLDLERTGDGWRVAKVARAPQPELATTTTTAAP